MKDLDQTPAESAPHAVAGDEHAHAWLDALADSFVIEIEQAASNDADTPQHCTMQVNAWWAPLI